VARANLDRATASGSELAGTRTKYSGKICRTVVMNAEFATS